jgi:hypothetical protein
MLGNVAISVMATTATWLVLTILAGGLRPGRARAINAHYRRSRWPV